MCSVMLVSAQEKPLRISGDPQKVEHAKQLVYELIQDKEAFQNRGFNHGAGGGGGGPGGGGGGGMMNPGNEQMEVGQKPSGKRRKDPSVQELEIITWGFYRCLCPKWLLVW